MFSRSIAFIVRVSHSSCNGQRRALAYANFPTWMDGKQRKAGSSKANVFCNKLTMTSIPLLSSSCFSSSAVAGSNLNIPSSLIPESRKLLAQHDSCTNIPQSIIDKLERNLHKIEDHPLGIIKSLIEQYMNNNDLTKIRFDTYDSCPPIVSTKACFDDLRIHPGHASRSPSDTYYVNTDHVLRTHTSAHQTELLRKGVMNFLCSGDVFRRDEIDSSHYPVFHQMEGVRTFQVEEIRGMTVLEAKKMAETELKDVLSGLARHMFGDVEMRWNDDYFPFTEPSYELEVKFEDNWLEVLGCGVVHDEVYASAGMNDRIGWAFGLGLERLAMILFGIPDIRLFWTDDQRFHSQFTKGKVTKFVPYSKYPLCYKDVSFWLPVDRNIHVNDIYEVIREVAGDLVEKVELFDEFFNKKTSKTSHAYRISYRHMSKNLTNEEVDILQWEVRDMLVQKLGVTLR